MKNEKTTDKNSRFHALKKGKTNMNTVSQGNTPKQLPNCVREAYLGIDAYRTAITLDLLFTLGYKPGQWITFQEALNVCSEHTAIHIIREGLKHWTIKRAKLPTVAKGRPTFKYLLPGIDDLKAAIVVEWSRVTDELHLEDFSSAKSYRKALHREMIQRNYEANNHDPVPISRKLMSERLNVTTDTLRNYEKELGTYVEPSWKTIPIVRYIDLHHVPEERAHNGKYLAIYVGEDRVRKLPAVQKVAGMYIKKGYEVHLVQRTCNKYAPYSPYSAQGKRDRYGDWADIINM